MPGFARAESHTATGAGPRAARAALGVSVNVPRVIRLLLLSHPATIAVSAEDVARGSVTVSGPRIDLLVNDRQGFLLRTELTGTAFTLATIAGLPAVVTATAEATVAAMPSMTGKPRSSPYAVVYELRLASDTAPGLHPWPVALTLAGL